MYWNLIPNKKLLKKSHLRKIQKMRSRMISMQILVHAHHFPQIQILLNGLHHPLKISAMIRFNVKKSSPLHQRGNRPKSNRCKKSILHLSFFRPRIWKVQIEPINLFRTKNERKTLSVCSKENQVLKTFFGKLLNPSKDGLKLPINPNKMSLRGTKSRLNDHMASIATNLHSQRSLSGARKKFMTSPSKTFSLVVTVNPITQALQFSPVRILRHRIPVVGVMNWVKHFFFHEKQDRIKIFKSRRLLRHDFIHTRAAGFALPLHRILPILHSHFLTILHDTL